MRRAISLLMMVVMVLAPCSVTHAASSTSHHAGTTPASSGVDQAAQFSIAPAGSHKQHTECGSVQHSPERSACSSNCDLLQRVTLQSTGDRAWADVKESLIVITGVLTDAVFTLGSEPESPPRFTPVALNQGSKFVLRKTARLRL